MRLFSDAKTQFLKHAATDKASSTAYFSMPKESISTGLEIQVP